MKILLQWTIPLEHREQMYSDFAAMDMADYQAQWAAPGIEKIGSWHNPATGRALAVVETDDSGAVSDLVLSWNSVAEVDMSIVFDDDEAQEQAKRHVAAPGPLGRR